MITTKTNLGLDAVGVRRNPGICNLFPHLGCKITQNWGHGGASRLYLTQAKSLTNSKVLASNMLVKYWRYVRIVTERRN
jgi:hypothetical protein